MPRDESVGSIVRAQRVLRLTQAQLGKLTGVSVRTVARWCVGESAPSSAALQRLARAVFPKDAALAARLAGHGGASLESLGLVQPAPPPPAPPVAPAVPVALLVDSVVCAAAVAHGVTPEAVRPALRAAFERAHAMHLSVEEVHRALSAAAEHAASAAGESAEA